MGNAERHCFGSIIRIIQRLIEVSERSRDKLRIRHSAVMRGEGNDKLDNLKELQSIALGDLDWLLSESAPLALSPRVPPA